MQSFNQDPIGCSITICVQIGGGYYPFILNADNSYRAISVSDCARNAILAQIAKIDDAAVVLSGNGPRIEARRSTYCDIHSIIGQHESAGDWNPATKQTTDGRRCSGPEPDFPWPACRRPRATPHGSGVSTIPRKMIESGEVPLVDPPKPPPCGLGIIGCPNMRPAHAYPLSSGKPYRARIW